MGFESTLAFLTLRFCGSEGTEGRTIDR